MIIPTPEYDPMYAHAGVSFRAKMIRCIERKFGDMPKLHAFTTSEGGSHQGRLSSGQQTSSPVLEKRPVVKTD